MAILICCLVGAALGAAAILFGPTLVSKIGDLLGSKKTTSEKEDKEKNKDK